MSVSVVCLVFPDKYICMAHKSTIVNVLGVSGLPLVINICPGIMKALHHIHSSFFDITCGLYTSTNFHQCNTQHKQKSNHTVYVDIWPYFQQACHFSTKFAAIQHAYTSLLLYYTNMIYKCLLHGDTQCQMMLFHMRHAVT
jgi:hypothetical protein